MAIILLVLVLAFGSVGCNPARIGPTPSGYFFWLETVNVSVSQEDVLDAGVAELNLIVSVENAQGHPLDGIVVEFAMDAAWENSARLFPELIRTQGGKARATFRAFDVGNAPVIARVETISQKVMIYVSRQDDDHEP